MQQPIRRMEYFVENKISLVYMCDEWEAHALENQDEAFNTQDEKKEPGELKS